MQNTTSTLTFLFATLIFMLTGCNGMTHQLGMENSSGSSRQIGPDKVEPAIESLATKLHQLIRDNDQAAIRKNKQFHNHSVINKKVNGYKALEVVEQMNATDTDKKAIRDFLEKKG